MKLRTVSKQIGKVRIIELMGHLVGAEATQYRTSINDMFASQSKDHSLIFCAQSLNAIDAGGAQAVLEQANRVEKSVLVTRDPFIVEELFVQNPDHRITIFEKETDAVLYLGKELIDSSECTNQRIHPRLKVALPLHVSLASPVGQKLSFFAIATNLAKSGMFMKFMSQQAEIDLRKNLNLYELPPIDLSIRMSDEHYLPLKGKLIHFQPDDNGFGIEFMNLSDDQCKELEAILHQFQ